jgi:hypothetical protein
MERVKAAVPKPISHADPVRYAAETNAQLPATRPTVGRRRLLAVMNFIFRRVRRRPRYATGATYIKPIRDEAITPAAKAPASALNGETAV